MLQQHIDDIASEPEFIESTPNSSNYNPGFFSTDNEFQNNEDEPTLCKPKI